MWFKEYHDKRFFLLVNEKRIINAYNNFVEASLDKKELGGEIIEKWATDEAEACAMFYSAQKPLIMGKTQYLSSSPVKKPADSRKKTGRVTSFVFNERELAFYNKNKEKGCTISMIRDCVTLKKLAYEKDFSFQNEKGIWCHFKK
jgi:hypothetical protein